MRLRWAERLPRPDLRTVWIAAVGVAAILLAAGGAWYWYAAAESRAASTYAHALARAGSAGGRASTPEARIAAAKELEAALAAYPSGLMAAQAALGLGGLRYSDRQYGPARAAYEIAAGRAGSATVRALARIGIASSWEAERNFGNAILAYDTALRDLKPKAFLYEDTLVDLARVQELAGKTDSAIATYRRLVKDVPKSARLEDVRARLASLGATP